MCLYLIYQTFYPLLHFSLSLKGGFGSSGSIPNISNFYFLSESGGLCYAFSLTKVGLSCSVGSATIVLSRYTSIATSGQIMAQMAQPVQSVLFACAGK
jgi:hypothetical protein